MAKMHELLAVEADTQGQFRKILVETLKVFRSEHVFKGYSKELKMFNDEHSELNTVERSQIGTTVMDRLKYTSKFITKYFDVVLQKEKTNQTAVADLIVGDIVINDVPATFLLGLESKLKEIRRIYEEIPTLDISIEWDEDKNMGEGIYRQKHPETTLKTKKQFQHQILVEPTEHHPAQIEKWEEQVPVGKYVKQNWCSMISSTKKAQFLERIDELSIAVKKARQRANNSEVVKINIGDVLMNYINK